jgi:threonine synthase
MSSQMQLLCTHCGNKEEWPVSHWPCACGGPRELIGLPGFVPHQINPQEPGLWRYRAMFPLQLPRAAITLGEGFTPLISGSWDGLSVHWKLEYLNPTGSFKDRGTVLVVNDLVARGVDQVVEDSSGNAGASLAAYAARAGIRARVFVPAQASVFKRAQIAVYGAEVVLVPGPRSEATRAAEAAAANGVVYASHVWHPLTLIGMATIAWEIWEQLGRRAPDWLIAPVGQGTLLLGVWRGFQTLAEARLIDRLPRLVAAQAERCAPLALAWAAGREEIRAVPPQPTVAEGIAIVRPVRSHALLQTLRESNGLALTATEGEIVQAQTRLAHAGLYVEPTSAVAAAVLTQIRSHIAPDEATVVVLTGSGLKSQAPEELLHTQDVHSVSTSPINRISR